MSCFDLPLFFSLARKETNLFCFSLFWIKGVEIFLFEATFHLEWSSELTFVKGAEKSKRNICFSRPQMNFFFLLKLFSGLPVNRKISYSPSFISHILTETSEPHCDCLCGAAAPKPSVHMLVNYSAARGAETLNQEWVPGFAPLAEQGGRVLQSVFNSSSPWQVLPLLAQRCCCRTCFMLKPVWGAGGRSWV